MTGVRRIVGHALRGLVVLGCALLPHTAGACDASFWREYRGTRLWHLPGSTTYFYATNQVEIDADGAPNAYHPRDTGLDALANAGYPNGGWRSVLVEDPANPGKPFVQPDGDTAGYFLAKSSLEDKARPLTDPRRYVDARSIPYLVFPGEFLALKGTGQLGDLGLARNLTNGRQSPLVVADIGPAHAQLGEISIGLAEALGGTNVNPRTGAGAPKGNFIYVVFPGSLAAPPWPLSADAMKTRTDQQIASIGGWQKVIDCVQRP